jgi:hypothetical protein
MIVMRGKGLVVILLLSIMVLQMPTLIDAGHSGRYLSWEDGLRINVDVENIDFWITGSVSKIFFSLSLLNEGLVEDFKTLIMEVNVVTEANYTDIMTIDDPWNNVGEILKVAAEFTIANEDVNSTTMSTYEAMFYYNFSVIVDIEGYSDLRYYTHVYEGTPLTISAISLFAFWPFPPIIMVASIFWVLYFVLRRFNKRYEGLESKQTMNQAPAT